MCLCYIARLGTPCLPSACLAKKRRHELQGSDRSARFERGDMLRMRHPGGSGSSLIFHATVHCEAFYRALATAPHRYNHARTTCSIGAVTIIMGSWVKPSFIIVFRMRAFPLSTLIWSISMPQESGDTPTAKRAYRSTLRSREGAEARGSDKGLDLSRAIGARACNKSWPVFFTCLNHSGGQVRVKWGEVNRVTLCNNN